MASSSILFLIDSHDHLQRYRHIADQFRTRPISVHEWHALPESQKDIRRYTTLIMAVPDSVDVRLSQMSLSTKISEPNSELLSWLCKHQDHISCLNYLVIADSHTNTLTAAICSKMQQFNVNLLSDVILSFSDDFTSILSRVFSPDTSPAASLKDSANIHFQPKSSNKKPSRQALLAARKRLTARNAAKPAEPNRSQHDIVSSIQSSSVNNDPEQSLFHTVNVLSVTQLLKNPSDIASTVHIVLDLDERPLKYATAYNVGIHPRNDNKVVTDLCQRLRYNPDSIVDLKRTRTVPVSSPCSVHDALLWHLDLMTPPRKHFIQFLAEHAVDVDEKERLAGMLLPSNYNEHFVVDQKTLLELLEMFPSVMLPLDNFLEECPRLQPRIFTVSSSAIAHPDQIHLTVTRTRVAKAHGRVHDGVCSTYLTNLIAGRDTCHIFLRKSLFFIPDGRPIIMCGTGAGLAPFRAFIQEAVYRFQVDNICGPEWHLFFGCRHRDDDFLYENELLEAKQLGVLKGLHLAFSREDPNRKIYIQDRMKEQQELVWRLIDKDNAIVFICGSTRMGKDVISRLRDIVVTNTGCSADKADLYVKRLIEEGMLVSELWG